MLEIKGVYKTFNPGTINEKKALNGIDLTLNKGDFVTVIGGNGAGKSTILNMITGVYPVDCGTITIDGVDVTKLPEHKRAKFLGRVFQDPMTGTAADMEIEENLALAARRGKPRTLRNGVTKKEKEQFKELLKMLKEFEEASTAKENQSLRDEAASLAKENARLEKELQQVQKFMENTMIDHKPISEIYEETKREEAAKHREDWIPSTYNER